MFNKFCFGLAIILLLINISCQTTEDADIQQDNKPDIPAIPFDEIKASPDETKQNKPLAGYESEDDNANIVTLSPPVNIEPVKIAKDSIEGYYIPTFDFGDRDELSIYALIISKEDVNKFSWFLCEIDDNAKHKNIMGGGFFSLIEGGIDLEEFKLPGKSSKPTLSADKVISRERFPAEFSRNELHIVKAFESDGKSSLSNLVEKFGELYFIRVADNSEKPLPTSKIVGFFHPTNSKTGLKHNEATFYIWSNGVWKLVAPESYFNEISGKDIGEKSSDTMQIKGTWEIEDNKVTFKRLTKCLIDGTNEFDGKNPPSETYKFVFDTDNFILWLTLTEKSGDALTGISRNLNLNETCVYLP